MSDWLACTICQQHRQIVSEHRVSDRRLNTYTRGAAGEDKMLGPERFQRGIQFGLVETAKSMLVDNDIVSHRF